VQYEPFYFVAGIDAGFEVEAKGISFCNVRVQGQLSGPGPLVVSARASVKVLFVRVSEHVTIELGSSSGSSTPAVTDVITPLLREFDDPGNIRAEGEDSSVVLHEGRADTIAGAKVVGVIGAIVWEQKRAPLAHDLERFEGRPLDRTRRLELTRRDGVAVVPESDWFGAGTFLNVNDSQALNSGRFTYAQSGIRIPLDVMDEGPSKDCDPDLELVKLPSPSRITAFTRAYLHKGLALMQAERGITPLVKSGGPRVKARQEEWVVQSAAGVSDKLSGSQAFALSRREGGVARPAAVATVDMSGMF
jgi:hypothetical protein